MKRNVDLRLTPLVALVALLGSLALFTATFAAGSNAPGLAARLAASTPESGEVCVTSVATPSPDSGMGEMQMNQEFDLMFIDMMTLHHTSAIDMSRVALERAEHQETRDLAQQIIDSQQAEIDQMKAWRDEWYPDAPVTSMDGMAKMMEMMGDMMGTPGGDMHDMMGTPDVGMGDMMGTPGGGMGDMMGMMDPQAQLDALCNATGPFDQAFLSMMIPHHQMALMMAGMGEQRAIHPELQELAGKMVSDQGVEITMMQEWLDAWYGGTPTPSE